MSESLKVPSWINELFPTDLKNVLKNSIKRPTTSGSKIAIEEDNVNDFVYYENQRKSSKFKKSPSILKQLGSTAVEYSENNRKYKCLTYLIIENSSRCQYLIDPFDKKKKYDDIPQWYIYFYLSCNKVTLINVDTLYDIFMNCPKPIECLNYILLQWKNKCPNKLISRKNPNKETDINFYKSLSEDDKSKIIMYLKHKMINLWISHYLFEEGNLERIMSINGEYKLAEYCVKMNRIDDFKKFVDEHRGKFKYLNHCHIIMPQFRELYNYAYSKTHYSNGPKIKNEIVKYLDEHFMKLIEHGFYVEIQFMISKGWKLTENTAAQCLKTLNKNMISLLNEDELSIAFDHIVVENKDRFLELVNLGLHPTINGVFQVIKYDIKPGNDHFYTIPYLPHDQPLDCLKEAVACHHPELIKEFIERFGNRFKDNSPQSWKLCRCEYWDIFEQSCAILEFDKTVFIHDLFYNNMEEFTKYSWRKECRNVALQCLKYNVGYIISDYLKYAIKSNDLNLAAALVRGGANPEDVRNWKKKCSNEMYTIIMKNL